jgi:hypothetical protein
MQQLLACQTKNIFLIKNSFPVFTTEGVLHLYKFWLYQFKKNQVKQTLARLMQLKIKCPPNMMQSSNIVGILLSLM